ncbi:type III-B CRISPR-associated protein Cas10/Cmr2 [Saccharolobus caldissimus]|uniref:Type III-B CRISPR-associated protein Cas10/Cmr2 n=1 Tax=Saccharolobus caldissimus TaxID=1702097 RepID=A0AAQ4CVP7_9CREN|nr:type III-B CRISPR-associated protein Cas10/Cmr2 [Saccharolobus caldissimus]BDB99878.1 type III-B CRISPR-associated protein Cas10/Cmr2 [Saccharolobus caldissimus]
MKSLEEIIKEKFAALLHDPPNKPFILRYTQYNVLEESLNQDRFRYLRSLRGKIGHKAVAAELISHLDFLKEDDRNEIIKYIYDCNSIVNKADGKASKFDRYLTSIIYEEGLRFANYDNIVLKNFLAPELQVKLKIGECNDPINAECFFKDPHSNEDVIQLFYYISNIFKALNLSGTGVKTYNVFYFLYELLWIAKGYSVGPAETRVPTHSIFDHLYATASILNWFHGTAKFLVGLDVIGVVDYIKASRKLRDLWASSYLLSALVWYILINIVERLGADIVLFPSLRFNPFFATYIYNNYLKDKENNEMVIKEVVNFITKYIFNNDETYKKIGIPPYAIIPARATLIMPGILYVKRDLNLQCKDDEYIRNYIDEKFKEGWKKLVNSLINYASSNLNDYFWAIFYKVMSINSIQEFKEKPPLLLRVIITKISGNEADEDKEPDYMEFDGRYIELISNFKKAKLSRISPATQLSDFEYYKDARGKSSRGFEYCSVCGILPAILILPKNDDEYKEFVKEIIGEQIADEKLDDLKVILSPGEKLCPWCLIKRALGMRPEVFKVLVNNKDLQPEEIANKRVFIPSVSHLASYKKYEALKNEELKCEEIRDTISLWKYYETYPEDKKCLIIKDPETLWFGRTKDKTLSPYYALVRADTDYLGDLLEGKLTPYLAGIIDSNFYGGKKDNKEEVVNNAIKRYLRNAAEGSYKDVIELMLNGEENKTKEIIKNEIKNEINTIVTHIKEFINENLSRDRLVLFPSWHVSISSMLNRILLMETKLVNDLDGFVVYAGGDDLLAILPVEKALEFVEKSRSAIAGIIRDKIGEFAQAESKGFVKLNNAYLSLLPLVGRSYVIYFSHIKYPLQLILEDSYNLLEEGKERIRYGNYKKDIVIIKYKSSANVLPLSIKRPYETDINEYLSSIGKSLELLRKLYELVKQEKLSKSVIYDVLSDELLNNGKIKDDLLVIYLDYLINRNRLDKKLKFSFNDYKDLIQLEIKSDNNSRTLIYNLFQTLSNILGAEKSE